MPEPIPSITCLKKFDRLVISFSGGKTSAYMTVWIMTVLVAVHAMWKEVVIVFANTGLEHERTLEYVQAIARAYGFDVVWVEAEIDPRPGFGVRHRVVSFETASRKGEPFEAAVKKHGLPNSQFPHCTRETKTRVITSYLRSIGWEAGTYNVAIGIRRDEMDRLSPSQMEAGAIYPLIDKRTNKVDVVLWDRTEAAVSLGIPEHWGNCVTCWKKSFRKLATVALELPDSFRFFSHLELAYPDNGAGFGDRRIFRERKTTDDIFELARSPGFIPFVDDGRFEAQTELDMGMACGESCEIGTDGAHDDIMELP
jgi:hypothetical protein